MEWMEWMAKEGRRIGNRKEECSTNVRVKEEGGREERGMKERGMFLDECSCGGRMFLDECS